MSSCVQALGCVLYACFILCRLCVPVFANMSREPFSTRALLLSVLHATGPGKSFVTAEKGRALPWKACQDGVTLSVSLPCLSPSPSRGLVA